MKKIRCYIIVLLMSCIMASCGVATDDGQKDINIYLIRHGQTYSNVKGMLVGAGGNYDLTEKGVEDAISLGEKLKDTPFTAVYSSPLGRACDTASHILNGADQSDISIQVLEGLRDIDWGDAEGYTAQEFVDLYGLSEFPDAFGDVNDAEFVSPINAETKYHFCERFDEALMKIVKENQTTGGDVLVVAHSSMAFWLQKQFPEMNLGNLENTTVTLLRYSDGKWELVMYNGKSIKE